jgi:hypothetical protein
VVPTLKLKVEHIEKVREGGLPRLESELLAKMHGPLKIRPAGTWLKPKTPARGSKTTQLLEKNQE